MESINKFYDNFPVRIIILMIPQKEITRTWDELKN